MPFLWGFAAMDVRYVNPFVSATTALFERMLGVPLDRGGLKRLPANKPYQGISGVIDLTGEIDGIVVLNLSRQVALGLTTAWMKEKVSEIGPTVIDATGELVNIICGHARSLLEEGTISMSLPRVLKGSTYFIAFPRDAQAIRIPFHSPWGDVTVDVAMTEPVAAAV